MNCFSMLPQLYGNSSFQSPFMVGMPLKKENNVFSSMVVLKALSQALNKSINNFQQKIVQQDSNTQRPTTLKPAEGPKEENSPLKSQMIIGEGTPQRNFKNSIEVETGKICINKLPTTDKTAEAPLTCTDDEVILESKPNSNKALPKKKGKKIRKEEKQDSFVVPVPEIDLIDHAYLNYGLKTCTLAQKKESLMLRKINDCADFTKSKKEKREIRMLF